MPELPEVETVRRGLQDRVVGRRIEGVEVGRERTVRRTSPRALIDGLTGTTVTAVDRRGKYLVATLDSGDALMMHLRMSGQLLLADPAAPRPAHTHVVMHLAPDGDGPADLLFVDPRTFGEVVVFDPDHAAAEVPELARLGIDPLADPFTVADLWALVHRRRTRIKVLLLDQHLIAGLGNIYSDEVLHRARIHPDRPADTLTRPAVRRLHQQILDVLGAAVRRRGSTLGDRQYVDLMGGSGSYQLEHLVYGRAGERCRTCGRGIIRRGVVAGRSYHWCPVCQRAGAS
jgi:formamidopyrimidine-DNA glycosylase